MEALTAAQAARGDGVVFDVYTYSVLMRSDLHDDIPPSWAILSNSDLLIATLCHVCCRTEGLEVERSSWRSLSWRGRRRYCSEGRLTIQTPVDTRGVEDCGLPAAFHHRGS